MDAKPYLHSLESLKLALDAQRQAPLTVAEKTRILSECAAIILAVSVAPPAEESQEPEAGDVNLTIEEAAAIIRRSKHWIYRHKKQLPWVKQLAPRNYVCSKLGMERWLARRK